jgi:DHA2 family multidrug resistance protein
MSSVALAPTAASRPTINPWFVAAAVVVPTFMEVLDTTIANVALRYITGGLSAANVDSDWVLTSYLAANATILPVTGWLSAHLGRRNYFVLSIAVFTIATGLCGMATSLEQLILFRVIQGVGGGGLQPSSQAILLDSFPPEKQGAAQTLFGVAALLAPVVGTTLGVYLTVTYDWRWIFYINLPVGAIGFLLSCLLVDDPDYLKKQRAELRQQPLNFDYIGLGLLTLMMSSWEVMLSKGQEWDWYNDQFWRPDALHHVCPRAGASGLSGNANCQSGGQLPADGRAELHRLLHHHFLCVRCALRRKHVPSGPASVPVRLGRLSLGVRAVTLGCFFRHRIVRCRRAHR